MSAFCRSEALCLLLLVVGVSVCTLTAAAEPSVATVPPAAAVDPKTATPGAIAPAGAVADPAAPGAPTATPTPTVTVDTTGPEAALLTAHQAGQLSSDVIVLGGESTPFLARYVPADTETPAGAVLFLPGHGRLVTADPVTAAQLREFAGTDWAILAPQMPLLSPTAELSAYADSDTAAVERVRISLAHLGEQGYTHIVMIGADSGAALLRRCLTESVATGVGAVAMLGTWDGAVDDLKLPVLEIQAERDEAASHLAQTRKLAVRKAGKPDYEQLTLAAVGSGFPGFEDDVAHRLRGWAKRISATLPTKAKPQTKPAS